MLGLDGVLDGLPSILVYLAVGLIILLESMGIPLPGEVTLISASLLASAGKINIVAVALAASIGAIVGDSIGYLIGSRGGRAVLERFGRRFPNHFGPAQLERAENIFQRWGVWAVFFGRFVALLRILAGPLAGALRVPYRKFLLANASGGIIWATGTALVIYAVGQAAQRWLEEFSWVALVLVVVAGVATTVFLRYRARRAELAQASPPVDHAPSPVDEVAAVAVEAAEDAAVEVGSEVAEVFNRHRRPDHDHRDHDRHDQSDHEVKNAQLP